MIDPASFKNVHLHGGFFITEVEFTHEPMVDALEREAIAQTRIVGLKFRLLIRAGLSRKELSVTLYHEVLEAATVASLHPPDRVMDFKEGDFERAAHDAHDKFGDASPENLSRMLQSYGFR
jgi:hypothetical protein